MQQSPQNRQDGLRQRTCRRCYFSRLMGGILHRQVHRMPDGNGLRHCVKNPPALDRRTGQARWPVVKDDDICGCFRYADENPLDKDHWPRNDLPIYTDRFGDYCRIHLTRSQFAKVDPEDYIWLSQFRWHCKVNKCAIYAVRTINHAGKSKRIFMHRLIANTPSHLVCDHINHNGLDNRKQNLRNCTIKQNNANSRPSRNGSSKYKGISFNRARRKWAAYIKKNGRQFYLGCFDNEADAAKAYDNAAKEYYGDFAHLNFPQKSF